MILATLAVTVYAELILSATFAASMVASSGLVAGGAGLGFMIVSGIAGSLLSRTPVGPWLPTALMRNAALLLSESGAGAGAVSLLVKPGCAAVALSVTLLWAGFAGFRRQALQ